MQLLIGILIILTGVWDIIPEKTDAPVNLTGWKSAQALTLGWGFQGIGGSHYGFDADFTEFSLIEFGAGLRPPYGLGIRGRLWVGPIAYGEPVASLKISYTPYMTWKEVKGNYQRYSRFDFFAEPGYTFVWSEDYVLKVGASYSISIPAYVFPITIEGGWILKDYFEDSGPYIIATAGAWGIEQPIQTGVQEEKIVLNQFTSGTDKLSPWIGFDFLTVGGIIPGSDFYLRHGENLEICALNAGFGFTPPVGIGLSARIWAGALSDWWWSMPYLSLRLSYSPLMVFQQGNLGCTRETRIDLFTEYGFCQDWQQTLRAGVSMDLSAIPWLAPVSLEAGWASYPIWDSTRSGFFIMVNVSAFGADFKL
ncbi:hypothetical protein GF359_03720 [candidate division WOR-3 bacterium]|uniref:Uncharacterized protein n=1 Tax=candidate division WOR-3 bacterium TaxID=2052148 RepID=A0A9D5QC95_UNCW3|nr:hypothetical protein [candidate division WOR-3 bacterium]MBD3364304.1 hypothetical protein [candidate division WOR-3 bacterium]